MFLGFGVDVSQDVDVGEVDPEPAEQRGHPEGYTPARKEQTARRVKISRLVPGELCNNDYFFFSSCDSRSSVVVDAVDLAANEDADPAVAPLAPVGQQEWNEQSQTCKRKHTLYR